MKTRAQIAIERLDEVAHQMERKWGVGRLPRLVSVDVAERFWSQLRKLNAAITDGSPADQEVEAGRMVNAWVALDGLAEAAGAEHASAKYLTALMSDGRLLAISGASEGMQDFIKQNQGQGAVVWMMDEIVRVLEGFDLVNQTKHLFDGARVEAVKPGQSIDWTKGDELPDYMRLMGAG